MDCKQCTGKWCVFFLTLAFGIGVILTTSSPQWLAIKYGELQNDGRVDASAYTEVDIGPFYSVFRLCTAVSGDSATSVTCGEWTGQTIDHEDCHDLGDKVPGLSKLCKHLATFRITAIVCLLLTLMGGGLVLAASCCQALTCGCCGNSLTCMSNVLFSLEVMLSVVTWAFAISSLTIMKDAPNVSEAGYDWAFWTFIGFGTVVGALAAWMADWAAEDSFIRRCLGCGRDDEEDERGEPLMGA